MSPNLATSTLGSPAEPRLPQQYVKNYLHVIYAQRPIRALLQDIGRWPRDRCMAEDARYEFEQCDGRRLKFYAGQPGKYVGVTERKGRFKNSFYARACVTKHKGDKRRQYAIQGAFASANAAAIAIADAEACPLGPPSPEGDRKPRTCALCPLPSPCPLLTYFLRSVGRLSYVGSKVNTQRARHRPVCAPGKRRRPSAAGSDRCTAARCGRTSATAHDGQPEARSAAASCRATAAHYEHCLHSLQERGSAQPCQPHPRRHFARS